MILVKDIKFEVKSIIYLVLDKSKIYCDYFEDAFGMYGDYQTYYIGSLDNNICKKYVDRKYRFNDTYEQRLKAFDL